jgi:hypothetical protein
VTSPVWPTQPAPKALDQFTDCELADLFGDADLKVAQRENAEAKRDQYRNEMQRRFSLHAPTEKHFVEGLRWSVSLSARRKETKLVNAWLVYRAMKLNVKELVELVMGFVPIWFLEDKLGKDKLAGLVTTEPTGYRTVRAVQKPEAVALANAA